MSNYKNFLNQEGQARALVVVSAIGGAFIGALVSPLLDEKRGIGALVGGMLAGFGMALVQMKKNQGDGGFSLVKSRPSSKAFADLPIPPKMEADNEMRLRAGREDLVLDWHEIVEQAHYEFVTKHNRNERSLEMNCPKELARLQGLTLKGQGGRTIGLKIPKSEFKFQEAVFEFSCPLRKNVRMNVASGDGVTHCQRNPETCMAVKRVYGG